MTTIFRLLLFSLFVTFPILLDVPSIACHKGSQLLLREIDLLQKKKHDYDLHIRKLLDEREQCERDIEIIRKDLVEVNNV